METIELTTAAFWESPRPHVAADPFDPHAAVGLADWLVEACAGTALCAFRTSGSQGHPKWVLLEKRAFLHSARAVNEHFAVSAEDRWLVTLPLHHVGGFAIGARAFCSQSAVIHARGKWDPSKFAALVAAQGISLTSLVPTQVHDLVQAGISAPPCLRAIAVGGGGMSTDLASRACDLGWPVLQTYGMTETASQIATQRLGSAPGSPMKTLPIWQLSTDADDRLTITGAALASGYATRSPDGAWAFAPIPQPPGLRTRDRVRLTHEGDDVLLDFLGRDDDWVKILGELVHLPPLQSRIDDLACELAWPSPPALATIPDERAGSRLVLVSDALQPPPEEILAAYHAATPSPIHRISEVRIVAELPRSTLGKIKRADLAALLGGRSTFSGTDAAPSWE